MMDIPPFQEMYSVPLHLNLPSNQFNLAAFIHLIHKRHKSILVLQQPFTYQRTDIKVCLF